MQPDADPLAEITLPIQLSGFCIINLERAIFLIHKHLSISISGSNRRYGGQYD